MQVAAEKFYRQSSRYLRLIRSGQVKEIDVTFHGSPAVRILSLTIPKFPRARKNPKGK